MADFPLRKLALQIEEIHHDFGPAATTPRLRGAVLAVVKNPFAGRYEPDLQAAMDDLKPLGLMMTDRLIAALGGREGIDAYGKGAIVGAAGELEHGALWHAPGGWGVDFDAMEVGLPDGPRPDEIVFILAMAKGPRVHSRMGGLEPGQIKGEDGLR